jgi:hypothetical protein
MPTVPTLPSFGSIAAQAPRGQQQQQRAPSPAPSQQQQQQLSAAAIFNGASSAPAAPSALASAEAAASSSSRLVPSLPAFGSLSRLPPGVRAGSRASSAAPSRAASPAPPASLAASSPGASAAPSPAPSPLPSPRKQDGSGRGRSGGAQALGMQRRPSEPQSQLNPFAPGPALSTSPSWSTLAGLDGGVPDAPVTAAALAAARAPRGQFVAAAATGAAAAAVYAPKPEAAVLACAAAAEPAAEDAAEPGAEGAGAAEAAPPDAAAESEGDAFDATGGAVAGALAAASAATSATLMTPLRRARRRRARSAALLDEVPWGDADAAAAALNAQQPPLSRHSSGGLRGGLLRQPSSGSIGTATSDEASSAAGYGLAGTGADAPWSPASVPAAPRGRIAAPSRGAASASTPALSSLLTGVDDGRGGENAPLQPPSSRARAAAQLAFGDAPPHSPPQPDAAPQAGAAATSTSDPAPVIIQDADIEGWARLDGIDWPPGDSSSDSDSDEGGGEESEGGASDSHPTTFACQPVRSGRPCHGG